ncbi:PL29 family lyase N-terminal domain-containing protein [Alistipes sp.]|uniref:PL29 family lyase N-terminal domain-containing protein n=1 Tax=Alistipes sp. TaxID=1872444 RepID=UPI00307B6C5A
MKRIFSTILFAAALAGLVACADIDGLRSDVDDLKSRVTALEKQVDIFNGNIETLQLLATSSTINTVTETADGYELLMSNGRIITLKNGADGEGVTPILSIDAEGYWMVDYRDGEGFRPIFRDGEKVKAVGLDGVTPVYGVDAEGYWTIDCGGGPVNVLDAQNNKVKATAESSVGNPFFSSAYYDKAGETFVVELRDDDKTVLNIPVVDNFLFSISDASGEQLFKAGETKIYPIVKKGVGATVVTRPEGWTVRLSSSEIAITAPAQDGRTRGAVADTRTDVAVLAYCTFDDYATITKVKVSLEGASGTHDPRASIYEEGEVTTSEIGYTVTLSDATSYKYVFRKTSEGALTLEEVAEQGTPSEETALRFQGLEARTEYTLYVLPYHEETAGTELATCTIRTAEPVYTSYYEAYNAGEVLTVGGLAISKSLFGEAALLTEETKTIKTDGVYFVPDGVTAAYGSGAGKRGNLIIVGDNPSKRGEFAFVGTVTRIDFDPARGGNFVLCNLHFKLATDSGQGQILFFPNNESGGTMNTVAFENCRLDLTGLQGLSFTTDTRSESTGIRLENVSFVDCDICVGADTRFGYFFQYRKHNSFGSFIFRNNVVWSGSTTNAARLINGVNSASAADFAIGSPVTNLEIENNTWINCKGTPVCYVKSVGNYVLRNNIFHAAITSYTPVLRYSETTELNGAPVTGAVCDNLGYVNGSAAVCWKAANPNTLDLDGYVQIVNCPADPFDGGRFDTAEGIFVPNADYASYGAQR